MRLPQALLQRSLSRAEALGRWRLERRPGGAMLRLDRSTGAVYEGVFCITSADKRPEVTVTVTPPPPAKTPTKKAKPGSPAAGPSGR